jgi:broad specificity polyphosphatase/5'/3'-nucleotidase SurE
VQAMLDGYISITPVHFDLTNYDYLPELEKLLHDLLQK